MKKYRSEAQIEKDFQYKITKKQTELDLALERSIKSAEDAIDTKLRKLRDRRLKTYVKIQERNRDRALKNFQREIKGHKTITYKKKKPKAQVLNKTNVLALFQLLARVMRADVNGYVECISSGDMFRRDEVCGGHYETRTNNATAFLIDNIRPQCSKDNLLMSYNNETSAKVKEKFRMGIIKRLGEPRYVELERKIQESRYTVNDKPDRVRLQELKDYAVEQIIKHSRGKILNPKKGSLLDKVLSNKI